LEVGLTTTNVAPSKLHETIEEEEQEDRRGGGYGGASVVAVVRDGGDWG
jgi:hypothetical protein